MSSLQPESSHHPISQVTQLNHSPDTYHAVSLCAVPTQGSDILSDVWPLSKWVWWVALNERSNVEDIVGGSGSCPFK